MWLYSLCLVAFSGAAFKMPNFSPSSTRGQIQRQPEDNMPYNSGLNMNDNPGWKNKVTDDGTNIPGRRGPHTRTPNRNTDQLLTNYGSKNENGPKNDYSSKTEYGLKNEYGAKNEYGPRNEFGPNTEYGSRKGFGPQNEYGPRTEFGPTNEYGPTNDEKAYGQRDMSNNIFGGNQRDSPYAQDRGGDRNDDGHGKQTTDRQWDSDASLGTYQRDRSSKESSYEKNGYNNGGNSDESDYRRKEYPNEGNTNEADYGRKQYHNDPNDGYGMETENGDERGRNVDKWGQNGDEWGRNGDEWGRNGDEDRKEISHGIYRLKNSSHYDNKMKNNFGRNDTRGSHYLEQRELEKQKYKFRIRVLRESINQQVLEFAMNMFFQNIDPIMEFYQPLVKGFTEMLRRAINATEIGLLRNSMITDFLRAQRADIIGVTTRLMMLAKKDAEDYTTWHEVETLYHNITGTLRNMTNNFERTPILKTMVDSVGGFDYFTEALAKFVPDMIKLENYIGKLYERPPGHLKATLLSILGDERLTGYVQNMLKMFFF